MRPSVVILPLLFLLLHSTPTPTAAATTIPAVVSDTCTKISRSDPNVHLDFCVSTLTDAARRSHKRHLTLKDLGLLSIKAAATTAARTKSHIKKLLKGGNNKGATRPPLQDCLELYSDAVPAARRSRLAVKRGRTDDAKTWMSSVMDAATTCDDGFAERRGAVMNPLAENDRHLFQLAAISLSIINLL